MSQDARRDEETATLRRARLLGLNYVDTSTLPEKVLYKDILTKDEMYNRRVIPPAGRQEQRTVWYHEYHLPAGN